MPRKKKQKIELNDIDSLEGLMQETYNDACNQINSAQNVINKINNSTEPMDVDDAAKIAKATTDALKIKDSAIKLKLEVGKLQNEVIKHRGDESKAVGSRTDGKISLNELSDLKRFIENEANKE